jgi:hypothetical protein
MTARPRSARGTQSGDAVSKRSKYEIEPMDLENMRQNGVRSLDIQCHQCLHRVILNAG